jgi:hypothetical protein
MREYRAVLEYNLGVLNAEAKIHLDGYTANCNTRTTEE